MTSRPTVVRFRCCVELDDVVAFNLYTSFDRWRSAWRRQGVLLALCPILVMGVLAHATSRADALAVGVAMAAVVFLVWPGRQRAAIRTRVRTALAGVHDPSTVGPQNFELDSDGVKVAFTTGYACYDWSNVHEVVATPSHIFIYFNPVNGQVIPTNHSLTGATPDEILDGIRQFAPSVEIVRQGG